MGSTAVSTGEALALTGAILGHSNPRSTAIYAHVQNDPSRRAANRVTKKIATALAGKSAAAKPRKVNRSDPARSEADNELIRQIMERLAEDGPEAERIRAMIGGTAEGGKRPRRPVANDG